MNSAHKSGTQFSAVLLAAGAGSRLGGRAKSLLEIDGMPLIVRLITALTDAGASELVVVLGHHADAIKSVLRDLPAPRVAPMTVVTNASPDDGQASSLRIGLDALTRHTNDVMIALADQPMIDAEDVGDLLRAFATRGDQPMLVPRVAGKPGNPVLIDAALAALWRNAGATSTGQIWRRDNPTRIHWFDTDNEHYRVDIDTPEDMHRFTERTGHALTWPAALGADRSNGLI